jgi:hypothetical protein
VRWAGLAGMLGGALFVVSAVVISSMPRGCIADACAARPMRETGAVVAAVGAALPAIGGLVQGLLYGGDYPLMPLFVIPGVLALVVGFVLLGIAVLRAGVLPRWAAVFLVMGSLAMLGFNDQNAQALLAIPFGIAWVAVEYVLLSGGTTRPARVE